MATLHLVIQVGSIEFDDSFQMCLFFKVSVEMYAYIYGEASRGWSLESWTAQHRTHNIRTTQCLDWIGLVADLVKILIFDSAVMVTSITRKYMRPDLMVTLKKPTALLCVCQVFLQRSTEACGHDGINFLLNILENNSKTR